MHAETMLQAFTVLAFCASYELRLRSAPRKLCGSQPRRTWPETILVSKSRVNALCDQPHMITSYDHMISLI